MPKIIKEYNKLSGKDADNVKLLNNLSGKEWTQLSKSVTEYSGPIAAKRKEHGAAFPPDLARHYIKIYTQPNDVVLDPFLGVGTVADTSSFMKRNCIGFEINPTFYGKAMQGIDPKDVKFLSQDQNLPLFEDNTEDENDVNISLYNESCQHISQHVDPESVDLILTSPPYADLLHKMAETFAAYTYEKNIYKNESRSLAKPYSDNNKDFGNLSWSE
jgi:DNA modification methylase